MRAENFKLRGQPSAYVKTADSGNRRRLAFCPDCGSALYSTTVEEEPQIYNLRLGSVNQRAQLAPRLQGFCRSAMPWAMDIRHIPQLPDPPERPR